MSMKEWRINYRTVGKAVKDATERNLLRAGRYVQTAARFLLRRRRRMKLSEMPADMRQRHELAIKIAKQKGEPKPKRPWASSEPGDPPRTSPGSLLKRFLLYDYSPYDQVVRIGPAGLGRSDAPHVLEYGGFSKMYVYHKGHYERRMVRVAKRPYMGPALTKSLPEIHKVWRNSIRG